MSSIICASSPASMPTSSIMSATLPALPREMKALSPSTQAETGPTAEDSQIVSPPSTEVGDPVGVGIEAGKPRYVEIRIVE